MKTLHRKSVVAIFAVLWCAQFLLWTQPPPASKEPVATALNQYSKQSTTRIAAFIRIPKTGSTSLLKFLYNYSEMKTYDAHLSSATLASQSQRQHALINCFYGYNVNATTANVTIKRPSCGHATYGDLNKMWNETLSSSNHDNSTVQMFTIVREPFERLRSLFYFMRKFVNTTQWCLKCGTEEQYDQVRVGDFKAWLELVHREKRAPPLQYEFLSRNVSKAIRMIQGEPPRVLILLNECFEVSLRLLEQQYSLQPEAVKGFVDSKSVSNRNDGYNRDASETRLRQLAKQWFADEYKFYDTAVEQFQRHLSGFDAFALRDRCSL